MIAASDEAHADTMLATRVVILKRKAAAGGKELSDGEAVQLLRESNGSVPAALAEHCRGITSVQMGGCDLLTTPDSIGLMLVE